MAGTTTSAAAEVELSEDALIEILAQLSVEDLIQACQANRTTAAICRQPTLWKRLAYRLFRNEVPTPEPEDWRQWVLAQYRELPCSQAPDYDCVLRAIVTGDLGQLRRLLSLDSDYFKARFIADYLDVYARARVVVTWNYNSTSQITIENILFNVGDTEAVTKARYISGLPNTAVPVVSEFPLSHYFYGAAYQTLYDAMPALIRLVMTTDRIYRTKFSSVVDDDRLAQIIALNSSYIKNIFNGVRTKEKGWIRDNIARLFDLELLDQQKEAIAYFNPSEYTLYVATNLTYAWLDSELLTYINRYKDKGPLDTDGELGTQLDRAMSEEEGIEHAEVLRGLVAFQHGKLSFDRSTDRTIIESLNRIPQILGPYYQALPGRNIILITGLNTLAQVSVPIYTESHYDVLESLIARLRPDVAMGMLRHFHDDNGPVNLPQIAADLVALIPP